MVNDSTWWRDTENDEKCPDIQSEDGTYKYGIGEKCTCIRERKRKFAWKSSPKYLSSPFLRISIAGSLLQLLKALAPPFGCKEFRCRASNLDLLFSKIRKYCFNILCISQYAKYFWWSYIPYCLPRIKWQVQYSTFCRWISKASQF